MESSNKNNNWFISKWLVFSVVVLFMISMIVTIDIIVGICVVDVVMLVYIIMEDIVVSILFIYIIIALIKQKNQHSTESVIVRHKKVDKNYVETSLYDYHIKLYKNKTLCENIERLSKDFHNLEIGFRKIKNYSKDYGFIIDIMPNKRGTAEEIISKTKRAYFNVESHSEKYDINGEYLEKIDNCKDAMIYIFDQAYRTNSKVHRNDQSLENFNKDISRQVSRYSKELEYYCGKFKGIYKVESIDNSSVYDSLYFFYKTKSVHYIVFQKYIVLFEYGSDN